MIGTTIKTALASAIAFSTVTNTVTRTTNFTYFDNLYSNQIYQNEVLQIDEGGKIANYQDITISNIIKTETKGLYWYYREIQDGNYTANYYLYVNLEGLTVTINEFLIGTYLTSINQIPNFTNVDRQNYSLYITDNINQEVINFLSGHNYTNYTDIKNLETNIATDIQNYTLIENDTYDNGNHFTGQLLGKYALIYLSLDWVNQNDSGEFLTTLNPLIPKVQQQINYTATIQPNNYEVIDLPGLMFEILGMPFAWLSTAFNLTLFPGTPYAINISHIIMAILGSLLLIVIVKKVIK